MLQFGAKDLGLFFVHEVVALLTPFGDGVGNAVDDLLQRRLALGRIERAAEVLLGENVGRVERPGRRHFHVQLLERNGAVAEVRDSRIAAIPDHFVVRMTILSGKKTPYSNSESLRCNGHFSLFSFSVPTLKTRPATG